MDYSITGSVVVEFPLEKAKDLPSLTADWLNMFTPIEIMWQENTYISTRSREWPSSKSGEDRAVFCRHTPADKGHNYVRGTCRRSITTSDCWHTIDIAWWIFMRIWDSSEWLANTVHRERHLVEHISSTFTLKLWILYVNNNHYQDLLQLLSPLMWLTSSTSTCHNTCLLCLGVLLTLAAVTWRRWWMPWRALLTLCLVAGLTFQQECLIQTVDVAHTTALVHMQQQRIHK